MAFGRVAMVVWMRGSGLRRPQLEWRHDGLFCSSMEEEQRGKWAQWLFLHEDHDTRERDSLRSSFGIGWFVQNRRDSMIEAERLTF